MATANKITVKMVKAKETKGTWMYSEEGDDPKIGTLYIKKATVAALGEPQSIELVVTAK